MDIRKKKPRPMPRNTSGRSNRHLKEEVVADNYQQLTPSNNRHSTDGTDRVESCTLRVTLTDFLSIKIIIRFNSVRPTDSLNVG